MNDTQQKQLGLTLWAIADKLRGAMNADDFRPERQRLKLWGLEIIKAVGS